MAGNSDYPETEDNYVELTDGVDIMEADQINDSYAAHASMQSFVGASGKSAAYNTDLIAQLVKVLPTIKLSYVDAETIQASAGVVWCLKSDESIRVARENTTTTDIDGNDLDAAGPTFANDEDYFVYADADSLASSVEFVVSTNPTTPTGPVVYQLIGGFSTNASGEVIETTVWSIAGMRVVDFNYAFESERKTTTTPLNGDNSIPQDTEGLEVVSIVHFVKKTTNVIFLLGVFHGSGGAASIHSGALFSSKNGTPADAVAAGSASYMVTNEAQLGVVMTARFESSPGKCTYTLRAGINDTATYALNSTEAAATQIFGGVSSSGLILIEFEKGV